MELENVLKLITAVSNSSLTSFTLDDGTIKLSFAADRAQAQPAPVIEVRKEIKAENVNSEAQAEKITTESTVDGHTVVSPLVGIFYSA